MKLNVAKEVAALERLTMHELRARYAELFGDATETGNRHWLVRRIAWRLQALAGGGSPSVPSAAPPNWPTTRTCACPRQRSPEPTQVTPPGAPARTLAMGQCPAPSSPDLTRARRYG